MSAGFSKEDQDWVKSIFKQGKISKLEETILTSAFDAQTEYDINVIKQQIKQEKFLKKVCLYKLLVSPVEVVMVLLILGPSKMKEYISLTRLYSRYYRKKISLSKFQTELEGLVKKGEVI